MDNQEQENIKARQAASVRSARRRLWAADAACYYAQKRYSQTSRLSDRQLWESRQREVQQAVKDVEAPEQALVSEACNNGRF